MADVAATCRSLHIGMTDPPHDLWVFGYGSLMWRPGFAYEEARHARLTGYRRCFCIYSVYHRGTAKRPGLVLGLDRGGACEGIAYRVAGAGRCANRRYLRAREQVNGVYREAHVPVALIEGPRREVHGADLHRRARAPELRRPAAARPAGPAHPRRARPLRQQPRLPDQHAAASGRARHPRARAGAAAGGDRAAHRAGAGRRGTPAPTRPGCCARRAPSRRRCAASCGPAELRRFLHRLHLQ